MVCVAVGDGVIVGVKVAVGMRVAVGVDVIAGAAGADAQAVNKKIKRKFLIFMDAFTHAFIKYFLRALQ